MQIADQQLISKSEDSSGPRIHLARVDAFHHGHRRKDRPGLIRATVRFTPGCGGELEIWRTKVGRDFSAFLEVYSEAFLVAAVACIRTLRPAVGNLKSWWRHVEALEDVLAVLAQHVQQNAFNGNSLTLSRPDCDAIAGAYSAMLKARHSNLKTLQTAVGAANVVFHHLGRNGLLTRPVKVSGAVLRAPLGKAKQKERPHLNAPDVQWAEPADFDFVAHGKEHLYHKYASLGGPFLRALVAEQYRFCRESGESVSDKDLFTTRHLLSFLLTRKRAGMNPDFFRKLEENYLEVTEAEWSLEVGIWREHVRSESQRQQHKPVTPHGHFGIARRAFVRFSKANIAPAVSIKGVRGAKSALNRTTRRNLAQVSSAVRTALVESLVAQLNDKFQDVEQAEELSQYLNALCDAMPADVAANLSLSELTDYIRRLNHERLQQLRYCAEDEFLKWYHHWQIGQQAMRAEDVKGGSELLELLDEEAQLDSVVCKNSHELFFSGPPEKRLGNLLNYLWAKIRGMPTGKQGRWNAAQRQFGGRGNLKAYLHAHPNATVALLVMLLVDSGANVEVGREVPWDCESERPDGRVLLTLARKGRAGGKPISIELDVKPKGGERISTVQAIRAYKEMFLARRLIAAPSHQKHLLLTVPQSKTKVLTEYNARAWFQRLLLNSDGLRSLQMLPSMIRPSKLLDVHLTQGLAQAQALADHESASTTLTHYTGTFPVQVRYQLLMREFTDRFESVAVATIQDAAAKLGIDPVVFEQRLRVAEETGLAGLSLSKVDDGAGDSVDAVPFQMTTRLVVASDQIIADIFRLHEQLSKELASLPTADIAAWESTWMCWYVFSSVAIAKLSTGETAADFLRVTQSLGKVGR